MNRIHQGTNRHQDSPARVSGLPFHPIALGSVQHMVAMTLVSLGFVRVAEKRWGLPLMVFEHEPVKMNVAVLVGERRPEAIFQVGSVQRLGNSHHGTIAGLEFGDTLDVIPFT